MGLASFCNNWLVHNGLSGREIVVVGVNFAPEHTGIAPYTTQACKHLASLGAHVSVLSGVPHYPNWSVPSAYRRKIRTIEQHDDVTVHRLWHTVPQRQSARSRATYELTFGAHVLVAGGSARPNVVLAVVPSLAGAAAAARIAQRSKAPFVVWVQDLMGPAASQSGIAGGGRIARATAALENWVLRQASDVVVVSAAFRQYVSAAGVPDKRIQLVPNWTHVRNSEQNRAHVRQRLGWAEDEVVALHSGNMGLKQGLENIVEAARRAEHPVRLVLMGDGNQRSTLEALGRNVHRLQFLPPAEPGDFPAVLGAADVLLLNERASAVDMSLPSKLTSYLSVGVPVVAAVPADGGTAAEVRRSGGGVLVAPEDPTALLDAIERLGSDPERRAALGIAGATHAREHLTADASLTALTDILVAAGRRRPGEHCAAASN